jgi:hypothetical protein
MHDRRVKGGKRSARAGVIAAGLLILLGGLSAKKFLRTPAESAAADGILPAPSAEGPAGTQGQFRVEVDWNATLSRDPFWSTAVFPPKAPVIPDPEVPQGDKAEELAQAVRKTIKLNGTFLGSHPIAIMNGKMFRTGDQVEGLLLRHIGSREVVLEKDGVKVVLKEWEAPR